MLSSVLPALSISDILLDLGYAGVALLMLAETIFPPIPSEAVLPFAGYLVERGELSFVPVLVAATAGSVVGAVILAEAARRGGRPFALRFLRFAHLDAEQLDRAETWFARRGPIVVLAGRCVPGVRSLVSLPAGVLRMPRLQYVALTTIGSAVWNAVLIGAGVLLGSQWERVGEVLGPLSRPLVAVVVLVVVALAVRHVVRARRAAPRGEA